jgi:epoxyqueuosine reductase
LIKQTTTSDQLDKLAKSQGLTLLGVADLDVAQDFARFQDWLADGRAGGMTWITQNTELRADPKKVLPSAQSVIVLALNYNQNERWHHRLKLEVPRIAQYARFRDYHHLLKNRALQILSALKSSEGADFEGRVVVDSAPILERAVAARAGDGFIGKNTCLISPTHGSLLLLCEILINQNWTTPSRTQIDPTVRTAAGGCGTCQRCQVNCPTGALDKAWSLDSRKCLSYWTIEHRGTIPDEFWPWLGAYWFGCDICQLVCPWNRKAPLANLGDVRRYGQNLDLFEVAIMDQTTYERLFGGSPMTRAKKEGLRRNALIAMTVTSHPRSREAAVLALNDASEVLRATGQRAIAWLEGLAVQG